MNPDTLENFLTQAQWCEKLGSPFTAMVCRALLENLDEASAFGARLLNWPASAKADAIALRACGALNFLARAGHRALTPLYPPNALPSRQNFWSGAQAAIASDDAAMTRFLDSAPQTNEVARSAALLPAYLEIARLTALPLSLREIGASAGLNLFFDRYFYAYGAFQWGAADANVSIPCEWRGATPALAAKIDIAERRGCDLNPLDGSDPVARARMLAYIWPDQAQRLARAQAALALVATAGVAVERVDGAEFAARELQTGAPGKALVLAHSIVWQYISDAPKAAILTAVDTAAARATHQSPFAWLRMEAEPGEERGSVLRLSLWPHGLTNARLGVADFHGRWVEWTGV